MLTYCQRKTIISISEFSCSNIYTKVIVIRYAIISVCNRINEKLTNNNNGVVIVIKYGL